MRLADAGVDGAGHVDRDELLRALAVAHDLQRQVEQHVVQRRGGNPRAAASPAVGDAARCSAWPVANSSRVSLVEVSLSTVMQLKLRLDAALPACVCSTLGGDRGVGEDEAQHRRHVGRDHAAALGDAVDASPSCRRSARVRVRRLGEGVGGHDAAGGVFPAVLAAGRRAAPGSAAVMLLDAAAPRRSRRSRRRRPASGGQPASCGGGLGGRRARSRRRRLPVKTLALPALTTSARALPPRQRRPAPVDRRAGAFVAGEDAGDRGAGREGHHHQVAAALDSECRPPRPQAGRPARGRARAREPRGARPGDLGHGAGAATEPRASREPVRRLALAWRRVPRQPVRRGLGRWVPPSACRPGRIP